MAHADRNRGLHGQSRSARACGRLSRFDRHLDPGDHIVAATALVKPSPAFSYGLFLRRLNVSLHPVLGDDEIVAAAQVLSGPPPYPLVFLCMAGVWVVSAILSALGIVWMRVGSAVLLPAGGFLMPPCFQRSMLVAMTRQRVVVARLTAFRRRPARVVTAHLTSARITETRRTPRTTTIVLDTPGTGSIRLNAIGPHRAEIAHVLAGANWAGVPISTSATVSALATGTAADGQLPLVARLSRGNGADRDVPR